MQGSRLLDIITITKDDVPGLRATLESARRLRQHPRIGHTVIDGSKSTQAQECARLSADAGARYFWAAPAGVSSAFNEGLKHAEAEWVWFLNGGDTVHDELSLEFLVEYLVRSRADVVIAQIQYAQSGTMPTHPPIWALWPPIMGWIPHPGTIVRRRQLTEKGGFDPSLSIAGDYDLWYRLLGSDVVTDLVSIPFASFDETGLSTSPGSQRHMAREALSVLRRHWKLILEQQVRLPARIVRDTLSWVRRR